MNISFCSVYKNLSNFSGGAIAKPNSFPWIVRLLPVGCGGSLISRRIVATAKHCSSTKEKATKQIAILGVHHIHSRTWNKTSTLYKIKVIDALYPPKSEGTQPQDFALFILKTPAVWSSKGRRFFNHVGLDICTNKHLTLRSCKENKV